MRAKKIVFSFMLLFLFILLTGFLFPTQLPGLYHMIEPLGTKTGTISISGQAPDVMEIYLETQNCTDDPYDVQIDGTECQNTSLTFKAWVYDVNGDCDDFDTDPDASVTVYICIPSSTGASISICDENNADYTVDLDYVDWVDGTGQNCNFSSTSTPNWEVPFYDRWENWTVNVTAIDTDAIPDNARGTWYYRANGAFIYPPQGSCLERPDLNLGGVIPGQFNDGTGCGATDMQWGCWLKNTGNIRLNMTWNATNFTRSGGPADQFIGMNGDNFVIDDDGQRDEGVEVRDDNVSMDAWPEPFVPVEFYPDHVNNPSNSGLRRCKNFECDTDEEDNTGANNKANYTIYWHIEVPSGLLSGEYNNTIEITSDDYEGNW